MWQEFLWSDQRIEFTCQTFYVEGDARREQKKKKKKKNRYPASTEVFLVIYL